MKPKSATFEFPDADVIFTGGVITVIFDDDTSVAVTNKWTSRRDEDPDSTMGRELKPRAVDARTAVERAEKKRSQKRKGGQ